jgi:hypothetical protein
LKNASGFTFNAFSGLDAGFPGFMKSLPGSVLFYGFALTPRMEIPIVRGDKTSSAEKARGPGKNQ